MKNQYFGDINDYRKYGLLRAIASASNFRTMVAWMLTQDDGGTDGNFISYLEHPTKWAHHDPPLYNELRRLLKGKNQRNIGLIETSGLITNTDFFSAYVPEAASLRNDWFQSLISMSKGKDLIFLDPDNGLEVKSRPYGRKHSSKFLYWREVESLWRNNNSLLIYQHFIRENRHNYTQRMLNALSDSTRGSLVEAFSTPNVVFLMALQPEHQHLHKPIAETVQRKWEGQIDHWNLLE